MNTHTSVVVGLGKTGLSCARYLADAGDSVIVTDSRERPPGMTELKRALPGVELRLGGFDEGLLSVADRLIVSPGVSLREPFIAAAARRNVAVLGDIELFVRAIDLPVVGVTGSNGKSTVTELIAAMLRAAGCSVLTGGNIGVPVLDLLRRPPPDYYVLELSSFQLERTHSLECRAAAVLNLARDHLDHHGGMDAYAAAKARIFDRCGVAVFNRDDEAVAAMVGAGHAAIGFGLGAPDGEHYGVIVHEGADWLARGEQRLIPANTLRLAGRHNVANVLAALALGEALDLRREPMLAAAQCFRGLPHRNQWVSDAGGLTWINDSKGTNVGASVAAIESVPGKLVLIAGGDGKGADFRPLAAALGERARGAVLLGKDAPEIANVLGPVCRTRLVESMAAAVQAAQEIAVRGDTVLLSPACSSLDMFANYEARGEAFVNAIRRVAA